MGVLMCLIGARNTRTPGGGGVDSSRGRPGTRGHFPTWDEAGIRLWARHRA